MSLQVLWLLFLAHPASAVNSLALFFAVAGAWLCLMTRVREQRGIARVLAQGGQDESEVQDERTGRINRFFYRFGGICLATALLLSWFSTRL